MSCHGCGIQFGFLKKEVGCEKCGFCFCTRCCKKQDIPVESGKIKKQVICSNCMKNFNCDGKDMAADISPPMAYKKRMDAIKNRALSVDSYSSTYCETSDITDKDIAERLQLLKRDRIKNLPSEDEITKRLALLKGLDPAVYTAPPIEVFRPDRRTSFDKVNDLIKQYNEEVKLDSKFVKPEDEISARLAALKDQPVYEDNKEFADIKSFNQTCNEEMDLDDTISTFKKDSSTVASVAQKELEELNASPEYQKVLTEISQNKKKQTEKESIMTEEEEADELVEKLLASNIDYVEELDSLEEQDMEKSSPNELPEEELPWCIICNEDAKVRCIECDNDLYCMRCFKECHDSLDIHDHRTCPYLPSKIGVL